MSLLLTVKCRGFNFDLYKQNLNDYVYESYTFDIYKDKVTSKQLVEARDALCRNLNRIGYDASIIETNVLDVVKVLIKNVND